MRHTSRTAYVIAVYGALCQAAPLAAVQDPKAVEQAAELRRLGTPADEIFAQLTRAYRLDAAGVAQVLARGGYPADQTATALAAGRVPRPDTAEALRAAGYDPQESVTAFVAVYRLQPAEASVPLREARYVIDDVARGLQRAPGVRTTDIVAALSLAGFDSREVRRATVGVLGVPADAYAAMRHDAGVPVNPVAEVLKEDYGLAPAPGGRRRLRSHARSRSPTASRTTGQATRGSGSRTWAWSIRTASRRSRRTRGWARSRSTSAIRVWTASPPQSAVAWARS